MISVAALGVVIAVVLFLENWSRERKMAATAGAPAPTTAEEEVFND